MIKLVIPPFVPVNQPSIGIGSLVAVLKNGGFTAQACYLNLDYLNLIGEELYDHLSAAFRGSYLSGEFLFTPALWPEKKLEFSEYEKVYFRKKEEKLRFMGKLGSFSDEKDSVEQLEKLYLTSEQVITRWANRLLADSPVIIGFSNTFQQTIPSLALARKVKELSGGKVTTVLGGANCRSEMGQALFENFDWVDYVVSGEAEQVILEIANKTLEAGSNGRPRRAFIQAPPVADLDTIPTPDFHDYFAELERLNDEIFPRIPAESSRGCWWGSRSHCTFCGLNGEDIRYRFKSSKRIVSEIKELHVSYKQSFFMMTDNIVHRTVVSALHGAFRASGLSFFYEIKANQSKSQLIKMAQSGINYVQPGIENLSTSLLKHINKGTSQLQNIQTLKFCTELGMVTAWNILYNLPGETQEDYRIHYDLIPRLLHLNPPSVIAMRLERFSSYWRDPEKYNLKDVRHAWPYDFVFHNLPARERSRLACYFDYDSSRRDELGEHVRKLIAAVDRWREAPKSGIHLQLHETINGCFVLDSRRTDRKTTFISPPERDLIKRLDGIMHIDQLQESVLQDGLGGEAVNREQLQGLLHDFDSRGWLVSEGEQWLSIITDPTLKSRIHQPVRVAP